MISETYSYQYRITLNETNEDLYENSTTLKHTAIWLQRIADGYISILIRKGDNEKRHGAVLVDPTTGESL